MPRRTGASGAVAVMLVMAAPAAAGVKASIETTARLGYDINPFLSAGNGLASGYAEMSVAPKLTTTNEKGRLAASAHYDRTEYFKNYGSSDQYGGLVEAQQRVSAKLTVFGALRYDSDVIGQNDDVVTGAPIDETDVNLIGLRRRSNTYSATGGYEYRVGPKDMVSADGGYTATRYGSGPKGADSDNIGGRIAWSHALSERTRVGISGSVYRIDYDTPGLSTLIMQPAVTFSTVLGAQWHFDASLGVSFSDLSLPGALADQHSKGISGSANLCHKDVRNDFCFFGSRSVSGSGLGGTVERTQAGVNYSRKINEMIVLDAGASYARTKAQAGQFAIREYVSAHAGLGAQVTRRVKLGVGGHYRDMFGSGPIRSDLGGEIYATLALPGPQ